MGYVGPADPTPPGLPSARMPVMRSRLLQSLFVVSCCLVAASCQRADTARPDTPASGPAAVRPALSAGGWVEGSGPDAVIHDAYGNAFHPMSGARVVSVVPSVTETLFALGLGASVVGVTTNCDYPPEAASVAKVGDYNLNYEKIVSLDPTIVVGSKGFTDGAGDVLAASDIAYFSVSHASFQEILESIHALGALLGAETAAAAVVGDLNAAIARAGALRAGRDPVAVFWAQWNEPLSTVGPGNFHHDLIEMAGGRNVAADIGAPYGQFSEEELAARDPEVVLTPGEDTVAWVQARFPSSSAVRTGRVYAFSSDESARPGPRLATALDELSVLLYPDAE